MIHPGRIETEIATEVKGVPTYYDSVSLERIDQSIEIAKLSPSLHLMILSYCTGTDIIVDGGMTLGTKNK